MNTYVYPLVFLVNLTAEDERGRNTTQWVFTTGLVRFCVGKVFSDLMGM